MSIPKKDRFMIKDLEEVISEGGDVFPPESIKLANIGKLSLLGKSNKTDLEPSNISTAGLQQATITGKMGQFVFTNDAGDLFDIYLYENELGEVILFGKRTRELPEKTRSK